MQGGDLLHDDRDNTGISDSQPINTDNTALRVDNPHLVTSLAHPEGSHAVVALVEALALQPVLDALIGHLDAVDIEATVLLRLEAVLLRLLRRVLDPGWVLGAALELHADKVGGESLGLEYLDGLLDGLNTDADVVGVRKVLGVDDRGIRRVRRVEADGSTGEMVLLQEEEASVRVR